MVPQRSLLFAYTRTSALMLLPISSPSSSLSIFYSPNPNRNPNPSLTLPRPNMKPTISEPAINSSSSSNNNNLPNFPFFSNPNITLLNTHNFAQSLSLSKGFSVAAANNAISSPIPISRSVEKDETVNDEVGPEQPPLVVVSFYKFADFPDHAELRRPLKELCEQLRVSGGIILAPEGINGSICGTRDAVEKVLAFIEMDDRLRGLRRVESPVTPEEEAIHHGHSTSSPLAAGEDAPFRWDHVRVKLKKEIVTLGMPSISPNERVGKYVSPKDWNALISDPDTVVIDVRNDYEIRIGKFKGAVDPCTTAFREFPSWVEERFKLAELKNQANSIHSRQTTESESAEEGQNTLPRVAMYCTGGIRCEKATSYFLSKGFNEVYHLQGGILKYLEEVPKAESLWEGECFVFDKRVSVEHGLAQGTFQLCYGCKQPISDADMESPEFEYGVSCPYCYSSKSEEEKERARARQKQFERWGIIGGLDKGRKPARRADGDEHSNKQI